MHIVSERCGKDYKYVRIGIVDNSPDNNNCLNTCIHKLITDNSSICSSYVPSIYNVLVLVPLLTHIALHRDEIVDNIYLMSI